MNHIAWLPRDNALESFADFHDTRRLRVLRQLVAFVCEAMCKAIPEAREPFLDLVNERLDDDFADNLAQMRARTLFAGLDLIVKRLSDE